jgi:hypothetical protein
MELSLRMACASIASLHFVPKDPLSTRPILGAFQSYLLAAQTVPFFATTNAYQAILQAAAMAVCLILKQNLVSSPTSLAAPLEPS